jgi:hypothetical protein
VAILIPRRYIIEFFLGFENTPKDSYSYGYHSTREPPKPKVLEWIDRLSAESVQDTSEHTNKEDLEEICNMVIRRTTAWKSKPEPTPSWRLPTPAPFSDDILTRVVTLSLELDKESLFIGAYGAWT